MFENLFSRNGLSLERLRAIAEVAAKGGIAAAVGDDPSRQSLYSRQIGELSEFFGAELTRRDGKGIALTTDGRRLSEAAMQIFAVLDSYARDTKKESIILSLGAGSSIAQWLVIPALADIQRTCPDIQMALHNRRTQEIVKELRTYTLDSAIIETGSVDPSMKYQTLGTLEYALFMPAAKVKDSSDQRKLKHLLESIPLASQEHDSAYSRRLLQSAQAARARIHVTLECESYPEMAAAVLAGTHGAILPTIARSILGDGVEILRAPQFANHSQSLCLAWNPHLARVKPSSLTHMKAIADILTARLASAA
ncbi:MAG: LysR family transcriptional regulator [bacterium]